LPDLVANVFARYLRANERTLENWEQGRRQAERPGRSADPPGGALPGYGQAPGCSMTIRKHAQMNIDGSSYTKVNQTLV
jgi:hypothetical protein